MDHPWRALASRAGALRAAALAFALLSVIAASPLRAQDQPTVGARILSVVDALNNLRYDDAIRGGQALLDVAALSVDEEVVVRGAIAAAFFPDESYAQRPDSALQQLDGIVRLKPDAVLPFEVRWPGLDSLFAVAKARTFAVVADAERRHELVGESGRGRITVVSSRPATFRLRAGPVGGPTLVHDSLTAPAAAGTLSFRALVGRTPWLSPGDYEFSVVAIDPATRDSVVVRRRGTVTGEALRFFAPPALDSTQLRPENSPPPRLRTALTGLGFAVATFAIASAARAGDPIRSEVGADWRAAFVGVSILGATAYAFRRDLGTVDAAAVAANAETRERHRRALDAAAADNARRFAAYRVTVTFEPSER